jgi:hypothetical protein
VGINVLVCTEGEGCGDKCIGVYGGEGCGDKCLNWESFYL